MYGQFASSLRFGLVTLAIAAVPQTLIAQEQETLAEVVVTGSRLVRSDLSAPSPTTVINQDLVQLSGDTTVEAVINELPQLSAGNNSSVNSAGGSGVLTANLRGLGAARTLTLVNGRRFIPANSAGSVDLATIPTALVERVEIITGGASAVYGSDAIAGAVNFLLRDDFEGLEVSTQYGETSESDGRTVQYDAVFGSNFAEDRGNVTLYASHSAARSGVHAEPRLLQNPAQRGARAQRLGQHSRRTREPERGADRFAERRRRTRRHSRPDPKAARRRSARFASAPTARCCVIAIRRRSTTTRRAITCCVRWSARSSPASRTIRLSEKVEGYAEVHYALAENEFQQAADSLAIVTGSNSYFEVLNYATNPVLTPDVRALFVNNPQVFDPDGDGNARISGGISRRVDELGLRNFAFERSTIGTTVGLRGDFAVGRAHVAVGRLRPVSTLAHRRDRARHDVAGAPVAGPELHDQRRWPGRLRHCRARLRAGESVRHRLDLARGRGVHLAGAFVQRQVRAHGRGRIARRRISQVAGRARFRRPSAPSIAPTTTSSCPEQPTWRASTALHRAASRKAASTSRRCSAKSACRCSATCRSPTCSPWKARSAIRIIPISARSRPGAPASNGVRSSGCDSAAPTTSRSARLASTSCSRRSPKASRPATIPAQQFATPVRRSGISACSRACPPRRSTRSCRQRSASPRCPGAIPT